jgi:hypothetical protein
LLVDETTNQNITSEITNFSFDELPLGWFREDIYDIVIRDFLVKQVETVLGAKF